MKKNKHPKHVSVRYIVLASLSIFVVVGTAYVGFTRQQGSYAATGSWASGAGDDAHLNNADPAKFGAWRGEPVTYATIWTYPEGYTSHDQVALTLFTQRNYNSIINLGSGWPIGSTWAGAANGSLDQYWRDMVDTIVEDMGPTRQIHLAFAYEFNGDWMDWSVRGDVTNFGKAYKRFHDIVHARKGTKDIRLVLPFAGGPKPDVTIQQYVNAVGTANFDILGVDLYDAWWEDGNDGNLKTQAEWDNAYNSQVHNGPRGWNAWATFAKSIGKPISHPEWGMSDRRDVAIVDNPFWVQKVHEHFTTIAPADKFNPGPGQLAGEAFFNTWDQSRLWPTTNVPNAAARYQSLTWGTGGTVTPTPTPTPPPPTPTPTPTPPTPSPVPMISQTDNLVTGKTVVSSAADSTSEPGNPISRVNDKDEATRWISAPADNATISVDLGTNYTLNKVSVLWAGDTVKNYDLQVSANNTSWTTIATGATNNTQVQLINTTSFSATPTGRYFRIVAKDRWNTAYGNSIWELGVYGTAVTTPAQLPGDVNGDRRINALDLSALITNDGKNYPAADFNSDGTVGAADMAILLSKWTW